MTNASPLVTYGIGGIALAVAALVVAGMARAGASRRAVAATAAGAAVWLAACAALAESGALQRLDARPPPMLGMLIASVAMGLFVGFSRVGARLARLPLAVLVGVQAFRFPLELVMHRAVTEGVMPVQMSFSGYNFDIVTGASAAVVAGLLALGAAPRWLVVAWNFVGAGLLAVIGAVAFLSTPLVRAFGDDPSRLNTFVGYFPFVWLPTVLVASALAGHVIVARRLLAERRAAVVSQWA